MTTTLRTRPTTARPQTAVRPTTEAALRDIALVLRLTERVRDAIAQPAVAA